MTTHRRSPLHRPGGLLAALGAGFFTLLSACSAMDADHSALAGMGAPDCFYGCSDDGPSGWDASSDDSHADTPSDGGDDIPSLSPLCGQGSCHPDLADSCDGFAGSKTTSDDFDAGDGEGEGEGEDEDAGSGGDPDEAPPVDGGPEEDAGEPTYACQVRPASEGPERVCAPAGDGGINAPCISSRDCAPGLACVGPEHAGICRPYCCGDPEACPESTFCEVRELRDDTGTEPLGIPVCMPAMNCKLLEAEPCASMGLICGIVRADGTTSCVPPGTGKLDEPCPCAFGYVCAKSSNKCRKLCNVNNASAECPGGTCQGGTGGLPTGFGVCVGGYEDAG